MSEIFIENPHAFELSKNCKEIRSYKGFDQGLFDLLSSDPPDRDKIGDYVLNRETQRILKNAGLYIGIHNKHACIYLIDDRDHHSDRHIGWYESHVIDSDVFRIHLAFRTQEHKDFSIYFEKIHIESSYYRMFYVSYFPEIHERYAQLACYKTTPKFYLELQHDCLEFAKDYCRTIVGKAISDEAKMKDINKEIDQLFVTNMQGFEVASRNFQMLRYIAQSSLGESKIFNVLMFAILAFIISYVVKYYF